MVNIFTFAVFYITVSMTKRSSGGVVNNTLDYQSRDCKMVPLLPCLLDETLNQGPDSV